MFYSHEILRSSRYGVATVWLVATIGIKPTSKKLTKKAIQQVDVQKACETIIEPPGAPIALRLQGSLLFGVSRVYSQQYGYLLADAEKVQAHMRAFYGAVQGNGIDPSAGKAKREHLILLDDPSFVLEPRLPDFEIDKAGNAFLPDLSQLSRKTSSQLSPLDGRGPSSGHEAPLINLDLPRSSPVGGNLDIDSPFGGSAGTQRPADALMPFGEDEDLPIGDFGLAIDADGNVIEEPGLPPHLPLQDNFGGPSGAVPAKGSGPPQQEEDALLLDGEGDVQMKLGEEALPEAEAFPVPGSKSGTETVDGSSPQRAPARKRRAAKPKLWDERTTIPRDEFKSWSDNYLAIQDKARDLRPTVGAAQARRNVFMLTFGLGVGSIGAPTGIPGHVHPLAEIFAGLAFQASILGPLAGGHEDEPSTPQGRRRSAREAFGDEEDGRRVRRRADGGEEHPLGGGLDGQDDSHAIFDNLEGEVGRAPGSALSDMAVPWNRHSSVVPSSAKSRQSGRGIGGQALLGSSPQVGRGSALPEIERYSDNAGPALGSDAGLGGAAGLDSSMSDIFPGAAAEPQDASQAMRDALDREGNDFLAFVEDAARAKGEARPEEPGEARRWVGFDDLFEPQDRTRRVVAQAFYHMLALATKSAIRVEQDGQAEGVPFSAIRLGVRVGEPEPEPDEPVRHVEAVSDGDETESGDEFQDHDDAMEESE